MPSRLSTFQSDIITHDRKKPVQPWDRKRSQDTDLKECPCFRRWPPGSKHALPQILKNQYQGQRRPVWGFKAESQEIAENLEVITRIDPLLLANRRVIFLAAHREMLDQGRLSNPTADSGCDDKTILRESALGPASSRLPMCVQ